MLSFYSESPLPVSAGGTYRGAAFDGCRFYLTSHRECSVAVTDRKLCVLKNKETCRPYTAICYDFARDCFWALSDRLRFTVFRLDRCFREIDRFNPRVNDSFTAPLNDISFCCDGGCLLAAAGNQLLKINPDTKEACPLCRPREYTLILSALCLPPYIIFFALRGCTAYFVLTAHDGKILAEERTDEIPTATAMLLDPCSCNLLVLTNKHSCSPYFLRARLQEKIITTLCPCNRELCRKCKEKCREKCEEKCRCCAERECADILESIALTEAATAHILNAEGEKLQKAIEQSADTCDLLKINKSVQKTILYVTRLEKVLISKLEALQNICGFCEPCPPDCRKSETSGKE